MLYLSVKIEDSFVYKIHNKTFHGYIYKKKDTRSWPKVTVTISKCRYCDIVTVQKRTSFSLLPTVV